MTDDLVERLLTDDWRDPVKVQKLRDQAAVRIEALTAENERLREALEQIEADCEADYPPSHGAIKYAARAALGDTQ